MHEKGKVILYKSQRLSKEIRNNVLRKIRQSKKGKGKSVNAGEILLTTRICGVIINPFKTYYVYRIQ